jgi:hypothetical protein
MTNPMAVQAVNGLNQSGGSGHDATVDVDFTVTLDLALTAGQALSGQTRSLPRDADFIWRAWHYTQPDPANTGIFRVRTSDAQGYFHSDGMILSGNISSNPAEPTVKSPEVIFPAGGALGYDITNTDPNQGCTVQICLRGVKRYKLAQ